MTTAQTNGRLANKVALITGGASGIGRECALTFGAQGAAVAVADLNAERAATVAAELEATGVRAVAVAADTSDPEQTDSMVAATLDAFARIDVCVAAAGISHASYVSRPAEQQRGADIYDREDMWFINKSLESWQRVIDVNLTGVMLTNQAVARQMRSQGAGGSIVNISSIAGTNVLAGSSDYCVSKAGVWMLTKCAAVELGRFGIRVNAVGPGFIKTSMSAAANTSERWVNERIAETPMARLGEPSDIANACLYLASDEASFVTGEILFSDGGVMAVGR